MAQTTVEVAKKQDLELKSVLEEVEIPEIVLEVESVEEASLGKRILKYIKKDGNFKEIRTIESVKNMQNYRNRIPF